MEIIDLQIAITEIILDNAVTLSFKNKKILIMSYLTSFILTIDKKWLNLPAKSSFIQ